MSAATSLHQSRPVSDLKRNLFRITFADSGLEDAWQVERLAVFQRVNRRATLVFLAMCGAFVVVDLLVLSSPPGILLARGASVGLGLLGYYIVVRIRSVRVGDWLVFFGIAIAGLLVWYQVFLELPVDTVSDYWMVTSALLLVGVFVLLEMPLPVRILLAFLILCHSLVACALLSMPLEDILTAEVHLVCIAAIGWVAAWQVELARRLSFARQLGVEHEKARTVSLLRNILPSPIADQLLGSPDTIAERHDDVAVLFADIVGFTPLAAGLEAERVVQVLDRVFTEFDQLCDHHGVEKIKTIGDAYMAAGGVPSGHGAELAAVVALALDMLEVVEAIGKDLETDLRLRIGVHAGPVVAGVIGRRKFIYDLWGDTVNTASRMEAHGAPGRVQVTETIAQRLGDAFQVEPRGTVEVKGKGPMATYFVARAAPGES